MDETPPETCVNVLVNPPVILVAALPPDYGLSYVLSVVANLFYFYSFAYSILFIRS